MDEITAPENSSLLDARYRTTAAVYFAQLFSSVIIICAGFFYADSDARSDSNSSMPLWVAIVFTAIAAFVLRRALSRWERLKDARLLKGFSGLLRTLSTNSIILGALAEAIAVFGFVIAVLNGSKPDALRAGAVALIVFFTNFPRRSVWLKIAANLEKV